MPKISILPQEIASKIAAGEIVERPASVVKELVENAFDAGARYIKINLKEGGKKEISVYDDGEGMEPEDLKLCYKHHATSKIKTLADLFKIVTYGFRGEALASISQVSILTIKSKTENQETGYEIKVEFGKEKFFKPIPFKKGTLVKVENLFENLPARKSFLKSARAEVLKVSEILRGLILCKPEVACDLYSEDKPLFSWKSGDVKELLSYITGLKPSDFLDITYSKSPYKVSLVITSTNHTFKHTKYFYVSINKRWIKDEKILKQIMAIIKEFFKNLGFPAGIIYLYIPPHLIDINVHPAKWEVRLKDEKGVFSAIRNAFMKLFKSSFQTYVSSNVMNFEKDLASKDFVKEDIPVFIDSYKDLVSLEDKPKKVHQDRKDAFETSCIYPISFERPEEYFKILGSFLNNYLLVEKGRELYIVDQHALSERIIFENLMQINNFFTQQLIFPEALNLSEELKEEFYKRKKIFEKMGFEFEERENSIYLKGVPDLVEDMGKEIIEELLEVPFLEEDFLKKEFFAKLACKLARKKGDVISKEEAEYLIKKMFEMDLKTCPHGRPLYFKISESEIEKKLRRIL